MCVISSKWAGWMSSGKVVCCFCLLPSIVGLLEKNKQTRISKANVKEKMKHRLLKSLFLNKKAEA